jgi:acyl-CoA thioesterase FadM
MVFRAPLKSCFSDTDDAGIVSDSRFLYFFHVTREAPVCAGTGMDSPGVTVSRQGVASP